MNLIQTSDSVSTCCYYSFSQGTRQCPITVTTFDGTPVACPKCLHKRAPGCIQLLKICLHFLLLTTVEPRIFLSFHIFSLVHFSGTVDARRPFWVFFQAIAAHKYPSSLHSTVAHLFANLRWNCAMFRTLHYPKWIQIPDLLESLKRFLKKGRLGSSPVSKTASIVKFFRIVVESGKQAPHSCFMFHLVVPGAGGEPHPCEPLCYTSASCTPYPPPPAEAPPCPSTVVFLTTVFMVRNLTERDCVPIAEGNRGCVMFGMSPPAHNNIMLATATHCCLF